MALTNISTKVCAIVIALTPKNVHKLRAFLELEHYVKLVLQISTVAHTLTRLSGKTVPWNWNKECVSTGFGDTQTKPTSGSL